MSRATSIAATATTAAIVTVIIGATAITAASARPGKPSMAAAERPPVPRVSGRPALLHDPFQRL